ncbi:MAG: phosphoenolpyruvate synthase [Fimbriimonadaceae bacterium]
MNKKLVIDLRSVRLTDVATVGGKNASLGELMNALEGAGVRLPGGFATTAAAYWTFLDAGSLRTELEEILSDVDAADVRSIEVAAKLARRAVLSQPLPDALKWEILMHYDLMVAEWGKAYSLAVRSSATAEDLPGVSFAGQHTTFLNVCGRQELLVAIHHCFASLFTERAIDYRLRNGFDHMEVALSVGVQQMVRSDLGASGVMFTLDTESGFRDAVLVSASYGLGETVVQGSVNPDEWTLFKPTLLAGCVGIIARTLGSKETKLVFEQNSGGTRLTSVDLPQRAKFCMSDGEVQQLAKWGCAIEAHYSALAGGPQPMDIEWAKDGVTGDLFILQARPETGHTADIQLGSREYHIVGERGKPLVTGQAVGGRVASGVARVVLDPAGLEGVQAGEVLVASTTNPDWEPVMKRVSAIVTDQGGRTAHAAIVAREIGVPCVVGTGNATQVLHDGDVVTVSCAEGVEGRVYAGAIEFTVQDNAVDKLPKTRTHVMVNVGDPSNAFVTAALPTDGVGLARMEFIVNTAVGIHPMALCRYPRLKDASATAEIGKRIGAMKPDAFFVERLSEGLAKTCAAFYPRPVIVRTSDFKSNEYAHLIGGAEFEPAEDNPMLGFRGACRYYDERYAEGFELECRALSRVRGEMGFKNMKMMIPFCRTAAEGRRVIERMAIHGLKQGVEGLEIYVMCELPSNVVDADAFLDIFDGFSIGSNDLTQLTLGIDRGSGAVASLFDEQDAAVKALIVAAIQATRMRSKPCGICGQAPSDHPEFAAWLVANGINSISVDPDAVTKTLLAVAAAEAVQGNTRKLNKVGI